MPVALICGIVGGIWAVVAGISLLVSLITPPGIFGGNWFLLVFVILIILMGVVSIAALALRMGKPRLASALIQATTVGLFVIAFLDPGYLIVILLPAAILLAPAAIKMSQAKLI